MKQGEYTKKDLAVLLKQPEHRIEAILRRMGRGRGGGNGGTLGLIVKYTPKQYHLIAGYFAAREVWEKAKYDFDQAFWAGE